MAKSFIHNRWIVNKKGKRAYGNKDIMRRNLVSNSNALTLATNPILLRHYAIHAWHWALALKGR